MLVPSHEKGRRGLSLLERPRAEHRPARRSPRWPRAHPEPGVHRRGAGLVVGMGSLPVLVLPTSLLRLSDSRLRLSDSSRRAGTSHVYPAVCTGCSGSAVAGGGAARPAGARVLLVLLPERQELLSDGADLSRALGEGSTAAMTRALRTLFALAVFLGTGLA